MGLKFPLTFNMKFYQMDCNCSVTFRPPFRRPGMPGKLKIRRAPLPRAAARPAICTLRRNPNKPLIRTLFPGFRSAFGLHLPNGYIIPYF